MIPSIHRSLCSTEGPSLRPDLPTPGALQRAAVKDGPQGHRPLRRAASLRAVRCYARLWKGGDVSDGLTGDRCQRPGSPGGRNQSGRASGDQPVTSRVTMGTPPPAMPRRRGQQPARQIGEGSPNPRHWRLPPPPRRASRAVPAEPTGGDGVGDRRSMAFLLWERNVVVTECPIQGQRPPRATHIDRSHI